MSKTLNIADAFTAQVRGQEFKVSGIQSWPVASLEKVWEYGLQRIFNDASAGADQGDKPAALALAQKRLDNLAAGILRASPNRVGDPVKAEAIKFALSAVNSNAAFVAWLAKNALKKSDKAALTEARKQADLAVARNDGDNQWMAQARVNVAASAALTLDGLDLSDIEPDADDEDEPTDD